MRLDDFSLLARACRALIDINEDIVTGGNRHLELTVGIECDIEVKRLGRQPLDGPCSCTLIGALMADERTGNEARGNARQLYLRDFRRPNITVRGRLHLLVGRQIDPELEAAHASFRLLRHLRMDDAACGRHPLHITGAEVAAVAQGEREYGTDPSLIEIIAPRTSAAYTRLLKWLSRQTRVRQEVSHACSHGATRRFG